jgi:6,7-dimethyl-8-ribityllumazine synthase
VAEGQVLEPPVTGLVSREVSPRLDGHGLRVGIVASAYNTEVSKGLVEGAVSELKSLGLAEEDVFLYWVPGAFELPLAAKRVAMTRNVDAIVALGAVIKGETDHYHHVASGCSGGLMQVMLECSVPVAFGVLCCLDEDQARARSGPGPGNKGREAARAAVWAALLAKEA